MLQKHTHDVLLKLRNQIIDSTLVAGVLAGVLAFMVSYFPFTEEYRQYAFYSDFVIISMLLLIVIKRRKIGLTTKGAIVILCLWLLIISDTLLYGAFSINKVLIVIIPFYSLFIFDIWKAAFLYVFFLFSFIAIGLFDWYDATNVDVLIQRHEQFDYWVESAVLLTVSAAAIVVFASKYNSALTSLLDDLANRNQDLEESQIELESKNEKLESNNKQLREYAFLNSHVLRAPLARMLGLAEIVAKDVKAEKHQKLVHQLLSSAEELDEVVTRINESLESQKIQTGPPSEEKTKKKTN